MRQHALAQARAALIWERAAPVLAGPLAALALFTGLALFGVFEAVGDPWRALIAVALAIAGGGAAVLAARRFSPPSAREAERRVEEDSGLADRPFEALRDRPAHGDAAMWTAHRARMQAQLDGARARRPRAAWAALDPYGARIAGVAILAVGVMTAGELAGPRLADAFGPRLLAGGGISATADFWIEPPEYTGRAAQFLRERRTARAPEGSILAIRIAGSDREPRITGMDAEIEQIGPGVRQVRGVLTEDAQISVRLGALRESVAVTVIEDTPPRLSLVAEPQGDAEGRLILEFTAEDDYGVEAYALHIAPEPAENEIVPDDGWSPIGIPAAQIAPTDEQGVYRATIDMSRHRLSGERALIRLAGADGAGQRGLTAPFALTVPARIFFDPLARAVAAERRGFIAVTDAYDAMPDAGQPGAHPTGPIILGEQPERRIERAPVPVRRLAAALDAIGDAPSEFFPDPVVYMGLRTAMHEVRRARELDELGHMDDDLWQIALRAELGTLADAEAALRAAEEALSDAFARGADEIELSALFDAYERAMRNYMQALVREAVEEQRMAENGASGGRDMNADMLQELLDALREATELGDTEGARRALAQLSELLRNMQIQFAQGQGGEGESEMAQALREAMEELSDLIGDQRRLMDETFDRAREGRRAQAGQPPGQPGPPQAGQDESGRIGDEEDGENGVSGAEDDNGEAGASTNALARRQGALRDELDQFMQNAPGGNDQADEAFGEAGRLMEDAERALGEGDDEAALAAQDEAIAAMREGAGEMARQLQAENEGRNGEAGEDGETDPFGRPTGRGGGAGSVDIPTESERQRARDILDELRRRLGDPDRDSEERGYIDRLLDRFGGE